MSHKNVKPDIKWNEEKKFAIVKTSMFRVSFPKVYEPEQIMGEGEPKYQITMLFPNDGNAKWLTDIVEKVKVANFGKDPMNYKGPIKDGDNYEYDGYENMIVINATTNAKRQPQVIDRSGNLLEEKDFYPGCWARASISIKPYTMGEGKKAKKGVTVYFTNIQKLHDDDSFSGVNSAADDFGVDEDADMGSDSGKSDDVDEFADL